MALLSCAPGERPRRVYRRVLSVSEPFGERTGHTLWSGLSAPESDGGRTVRWSDGPRSVGHFLLNPRFASYRLTLTCRGAAPQEVEVSVNDHPLGGIRVAPRFRTYRLPVPAEALRAGHNRLRFDYENVVSPPEDDRDLAVQLDELSLQPSFLAVRRRR